MPEQKIGNTTFADGCRGFAAMIRSGAMTPEDHEMVAKKFSDAADLIDKMTVKAFPEAYDDQRATRSVQSTTSPLRR